MEYDMADPGLSDANVHTLGTALLLTCLRSRFADLRTVHEVDKGAEVIGVNISEAKTLRDDRLPKVMLGPRLMASGGDWFEAFLVRRAAMGCPFPEYPAYPSWIANAWSHHTARLQDFNASFRQLLLQLGAPTWSQYTSHSCKA
eukprot:9780828-Karenia_brevis.AAC.1